MTQVDLHTFFTQQLAAWPACQARYEALAAAETRTLTHDGRSYRLTFNPARSRSARAAVSATTAQQPASSCFLCPEARPVEQQCVEITTLPLHHTYSLAVNPYPITSHHFTIIADQHIRQDCTGRLWDMAFFADLFPDYLIFFNGALSGASAPSHLHFQAVPKTTVPLVQWSEDVRTRMGVQRQMPTVTDSDHANVLVWTEGEEVFWLVVNRIAHRPSAYFLDDNDPEKVLISPASLEYGGLIPLSRKEDFDKMTIEKLEALLQECSHTEPVLRIGVCEGKQIRFSAGERTHAMHYLGEGAMRDIMDYGSNRAEAAEQTEYWCHQSPFTLEGVTIGKEFHWQQQEDQVFSGALHIIAAEGTLHAINYVTIEEYLKSVISSEMAATNNLALLKAHAISSRSWALCNAGHAGHTLYDLCADDHCQRYQGLGRQSSPLVERAIQETRGLVLTDAQGHICDTRYSKCCGGRTERFSTCWEDIDPAYLQPVDDPFCSPHFLATLPGGKASVLSQVLNSYDQSTTDFHDWEVRYTTQQLSQLVAEKLGLDLGDVVQLEALERGASGRIKRLRIVGTKGETTIGKELRIRKALSPSHLYSSWFESTREDDNWVLRGHGWGHGVGLCQIGAAAMALAGHSAEDILTHYYPSARLTRLY